MRKETREKFILFNNCSRKASLTVEASFVMPIFLYFIIAFLYFIQIFTVQEQIQSAITKMGLNLARSAYVLDEFIGPEEVQNYDQSIFNTDYTSGLQELTSATVNGGLLKLYISNYLDADIINLACIKDGFEGISFYYSKVMDETDCIDIIMTYWVDIPIELFHLKDMFMLQRIRLRGWTGHQVPATYSMSMEEDETDNTIVYITQTGTVYHVSRECSHIKLSVISVMGIPTDRRNDSGAKYYPCESCCSNESNEASLYYITSNGSRYHTRKDCSKIKRTVIEVALSEVSERNRCLRCGK